ncbi:hypothetical protein ACFYWD_20730 [Streptomyces sp. NPDC003781]|uniref:hypothetical protein n=1 Tax=Streptomyces sp. NPDC003781 TaxID=3364686 RepID=UPI0036A0FB91
MPTPDAYGQGIQIWSMTDAPSIPDAIKAVADGLIPRSILRFASASERGATLVDDQAPVEGMMAWLKDQNLLTLYDGSSWSVVAAGSQAWTAPALATGYTNNGNSNGTVRWRKVNLFGEDAIMWSGGLNVTYVGAGSSPANGGMFLSTTMPAGARPTSRRTVTAACSGVNSDQLSMKIDFNTDGTVTIVAKGGAEPPWISLNNIMYTL